MPHCADEAHFSLCEFYISCNQIINLLACGSEALLMLDVESIVIHRALSHTERHMQPQGFLHIKLNWMVR